MQVISTPTLRRLVYLVTTYAKILAYFSESTKLIRNTSAKLLGRALGEALGRELGGVSTEVS